MKLHFFAITTGAIHGQQNGANRTRRSGMAEISCADEIAAEGGEAVITQLDNGQEGTLTIENYIATCTALLTSPVAAHLVSTLKSPIWPLRTIQLPMNTMNTTTPDA